MTPFTLIFFLVGIAALIVGAQFLVSGAARLAVAIGVSPMVIGLTVVAFGTGSPELAVGVHDSLTGETSLALGNVVGSNIANILLVIGVSALIAPLSVRQRLVRWDVPLMIGVSVLMLLLSANGRLGRLEGLVLFCGIIVYTLASFFLGRRDTASERAEAAREPEEETRQKPVKTFSQGVLQGIRIALVLGLLVLGSSWVVEGARELALFLGISQLIIGLTVVALGTSLPELATSVVAILHGHRDMAVGNAIGSNIFNILAVLGISALLAPDGVRVPSGALRFDIPVMIAVAIACLPVTFTGCRVNRWEGAVFLGYYVAYLFFLFLSATRHEQLPLYNLVMLSFVLPLTVLGVGLSLLAALRRNRIENESNVEGQEQDPTTSECPP
ncbi:calcium/sodium antiporter [soil metagenome]